MFCEVSPELAELARARARGLGHDLTTRTAIEARVLVTERVKPLDHGGRASIRSGCRTTGARKGSSPATRRTTCCGLVLDPNVHIQEVKAFDLRHPPWAQASRAGAAELVERSRIGECRHVTLRSQHAGRRLRRRSTRRGWASSPTQSSASAARRARSPARSGTWFPRTGSAGPASPTTTPGALGADTWRHVAFIEQQAPLRPSTATARARRRRSALADELRCLQALHRTPRASTSAPPARSSAPSSAPSSSRRTSATAAATACPPARSASSTGAVPDEATGEPDGRAFKCTLCYDRLKGGHEPACAKACPTQSIQFGPLDELRERAAERLEKLQADGMERRPALRRGPGRRRRWVRRVLPAARRAGGLWAAAGPAGDDPRPSGDVAYRCSRRRRRSSSACSPSSREAGE